MENDIVKTGVEVNKIFVAGALLVAWLRLMVAELLGSLNFRGFAFVTTKVHQG